jgi:hypothetical protein
MVRLATALAGVSVLGVFAAVQVSSAAAPAVTATLSPAGSLSVPQGDPFPYSLTLSSQEIVEQHLQLRLKPTGSSTQVFYDGETIEPGATTVRFKNVVPSQWFAGLGSYQVVVTTEDGVSVGQPLTFTVTPARVQPAVFQDLSTKVGIGVPTPQKPCSMQVAGAAWADVNRDGRLDLFLPRGQEQAMLFINRGKRGFRNEAAARGVAGNGTLEYGGVFADYDNDGDPDLYVTREGTDVLYRNNGKGRFSDVTALAKVGGGNLSHRTASWGDYDNDGRLDLYVTNYGFCYGPGQADQLFHQNRNGTFTDVSNLIQADYSLTPDLGQGRGFEAAWFDYNGDGRQDLFLANDHFLEHADVNRLWRNDGPGPNGRWRFTDVSAPSGMGVKMNSMGIGIGDYNRDGRFDVAVSNISANGLFRGNGDGTFTNVAAPTGTTGSYQAAGQGPITWGTTFGDFNLDGWEDLYFAAGYIEVARPVPQRDEVFVNDHGQHFLDLRAPSHADDPGWSRGVSTADYDRDGRLDLVVADQAGTAHLYRNVTPRGKNHWLEVATVGTRSNRDGCGARLIARIKGASLLREVFCGSVGLAGGSDPVVHYGLGAEKKVARLNVTWPSGVKQVFRNVKADRRLTVTEPKV